MINNLKNMEFEDFIEKFAEQFEDTPKNHFCADLKYRELDEWSSLVAVCIITMVDEEYGVVLTGEDIRESETVEDVFNIIKAKVTE